MDTQTLRQRSTNDTATTATAGKTTRDKKRAMARRGLRSLAAAVIIPLFLSIISSILSSVLSSTPITHPSPPWRPPSRAVHAAGAVTASLMGLAAWLVWAEGGMRNPAAGALYAAQLAFAVAWAPAVMCGSGRAGLGISVALVAAQVECSRRFRRVNPIAGDIARACIAWGMFLVFASYKMM